MNSFNHISKQRDQISQRTTEMFPNLVNMFKDGISLLIDATEILEKSEGKPDNTTADGASKLATWRFLSTLPTSATWCFNSAQNGDYSIAKNLLRLSLEEMVKLAYYVTFPDKALREIIRGRNNDNINLDAMLQELKAEDRNVIMRLHGDLSALYVHANLNVQSELVFSDTSGEISQISGGPQFIPDQFSAITIQLFRIIGRALVYIIIRFPTLSETSDWQERTNNYLESVINEVNSY